MSQSEEGMNMVKQLIAQFQNKAGMFREGGKLDSFIKKYKGGGKEDGQRPYDRSITEFHGVDVFPYTNGVDRSRNGSINRKPHPNGTRQETLQNGVGLRQITRNNITTTELVSPDKRDTMYVHDGVAGRVDSNIDDSGVLGMLGLKKPTPVSSRYRYLQDIFNNTEFKNGGTITKAFDGEKVEPTEKKAKNGKTYTVVPADTTENGYVTRRIYRKNGDKDYAVTEQVYKVGDLPGARYRVVPHANLTWLSDPLNQWKNLPNYPFDMLSIEPKFSSLFEELYTK